MVVLQQTVNLFPRGKQWWFESIFTHQIRLVNIMVIMPACLAGHRSSILLRVATLSQSMEVVYPSGLISHEIVGSNPTSATKPAANHC